MPGAFPPLDAAERTRPGFAPPLGLGRPAGDEWRRVADLADARSGALAAALATMAEVRGYPDRRAIGAGFALITSAAVAGLVDRAAGGRPVPVLLPDQTWWRLRPSANVTEVAVTERPEYWPPERLGEALHLLLDGLYGAIQEQTGFPVRALWAQLASAIGFWSLELFPDDHAGAVARAESIFAGDAMLRVVKPRVTWVEVDGAPRAFTTRRVCCFNYLGRSGATCGSQCPIVPAAERLAGAIAAMEQEARP